MQGKRIKDVVRATLASVALSMSLVPAPALAQGATETVLVQDASQTVDGNVEVTDTANALKVVSTGANDASAQVSGDVSNTNNGTITGSRDYVIGANLQSHGTGLSSATVDGNVTVSSTPEESQSRGVGVYVRDGLTTENARVSAEVKGDVKVDAHGPARGVSTMSDNAKSDFTVKVGGNITTTSTGAAPSGVEDADGVEVQTAKDAITHIFVGGNITVSDPVAGTSAYGVSVYGDSKSLTDIQVKGNVLAVGADEAIGVRLSSSAGDVRAVTGGDVRATSSGTGQGIGAELEARNGGRVEFVAAGTVYGDKAGISFDGDGKSIYDVTVWQVKAGENGSLFSKVDFSEENIEAVSRQVSYIIRLEQPQAGGTVQALDALHAALAQSHGYDVAHAGDKVYLNVDLAQGYFVSGAFNGAGERVALLKDEGGYYVVVPEGGGVYLSVCLGKDKDVQTTSVTEPAQNQNAFATVSATPVAYTPATAKVATNTLPATADSTTLATALAVCFFLGAGFVVSGAIKKRCQ